MAYNKEAYEKNREKIKEYRKKYFAEKKEKVLAWRKKQYETHKQKLQNDPEYRARYNAKLREYRQKNPDVLKKAYAKYQDKMKSLTPEEIAARLERRRENQRQRYQKNREKLLAANHAYREKNREKINARRSQRYKDDPTYNRAKKVVPESV